MAAITTTPIDTTTPTPSTIPAATRTSSKCTARVLVYCVSDVHTDHDTNMTLMNHLGDTTHTHDRASSSTSSGSGSSSCGDTRVLILAGDVSSEPQLLRATLQSLVDQRTFDWIFFCHGNNELRLTRRERKSSSSLTSIDKFHHVFDMCHQLGVHTQPRFIAPSCTCTKSVTNSSTATSDDTKATATVSPSSSSSSSSASSRSIDSANLTSEQIMSQLYDDMNGSITRCGGDTAHVVSNGVLIVPLFAWYTPLFDKEFKHDVHYQRGWLDFRACEFPPQLQSRAADWNATCDWFHNFTTKRLATLMTLRSSTSSSAASSSSPSTDVSSLLRSVPLITYSHFLPRRDLLPRLAVMNKPTLPYVMGDAQLDELIRTLRSTIHVYGHSHIDNDQMIDGIRYVQNAMKHPEQRRGIMSRVAGHSYIAPKRIFTSSSLHQLSTGTSTSSTGCICM